jgi:hypothetical protein
MVDTLDLVIERVSGRCDRCGRLLALVCGSRAAGSDARVLGECFPEVGAGFGVVSASRGRVESQYLCGLRDAQSVPVDQHDELTLCLRQSVDSVSDGYRSWVSFRALGAGGGESAAQAVCEGGAPAGGTVVVRQDVRGDGEQPHALADWLTDDECIGASAHRQADPPADLAEPRPAPSAALGVLHFAL